MKSFELPSRLHINNIISADYLSDDYSGKISDNLCLIYLVSGKADITIKSDVYEIKENTFAIIAPNEFHCLKIKDESQYLYIELTFEKMNINSNIISPSYNDIILLDEISYIINFNNSSSLPRLYQILELVITSAALKDNDYGKKDDRDALFFAKASDIMSQNITESLSVDSIADSLGISVSHLKRIFTKYALVGVHEYLTFIKVIKAKELLKQGITVTETASLSGFSNQAYFSSAFKRVTGLSPKEFAGDVKAKKTTIKAPAPKPTKELPNYLL